MAVIRQNTKVFNQPVGVVRANAGASELGQSIAAAANRASDIFYREGAIRAEDAGTKEGIAQPASKIISINPETGLPEAYEAPAGFGRIASRAYQSMIDRRFEDSIQDEIKLRGQEIAQDAASADEFRTRMTNYVQSMYANAVGEGGELNAYGRMIEEAGTTYVASAYTSLRNKEIKAQRAALKRQQQIAAFGLQREISAMVSSGASLEAVAPLIDRMIQTANDQFETGGSFSSWQKSIEAADGFKALAANNQLVSSFSSMDETSRKQFKSAVLSRDVSEINRIGSMVGQSDLGMVTLLSLVDTSPASLVSAMDAAANARGEFVEDLVESALTEADIGPSTSNTEIYSLAVNLPEQMREPFIAEASIKMVEAKAGKFVDTVAEVDALVNELNKVDGVNSEVIADILGPQAAGAVMQMTHDVRSSMAQSLNTRRAALNAQENRLTESQVNAYGAAVNNIAESNDPIGLFKSERAKIEKSSLPPAKKRELTGIAESITAERARQIALNTPVSAEEMEAIRNGVRKNEQPTLSPAGVKVYNLYRGAYELQPATVDGEMGRRLTALSNDADRKVSERETFVALQQAANGQALSKEQQELLDKEVFAGLNTMSDLVDNPAAMGLLSKGQSTDKIKRLFSRAITSIDEGEVDAAIGLFQRLSVVQGETENGEIVDIDYMRRILPEKTYAQYATASYASAKSGLSAKAVFEKVIEAGGIEAIDAELKQKFDVPKSGSVGSILSEYTMSAQYRDEVLSMLRMMHATGQEVSKQTVDGWVDDYNNISARDSDVIGYNVEDRSVYARQIYFSGLEMVSARDDLIDMIAEDASNRKLLKGGTNVDAFLGGLGFLNPLSMGESAVRAFSDIVSGTSEGAEAMSDEARIRAGLKTLRFDLKYKPNIASFRAGVPSYYVGYMSGGMFVNIEVNDEPLMLTKQTPEGNDTLVAKNKMDVAIRSGQPDGEIAELTIDYYATLAHNPLTNQDEVDRLNGMLGDESALDLYNKAKERMNEAVDSE